MLFLVNEKHTSDDGYFVQRLTSLIINSNSMKLTQSIINFYRKAFDEQESEVSCFCIYVLVNFRELFRLILTSSNV